MASATGTGFFIRVWNGIKKKGEIQKDISFRSNKSLSAGSFCSASITLCQIFNIYTDLFLIHLKTKNIEWKVHDLKLSILYFIIQKLLLLLKLMSFCISKGIGAGYAPASTSGAMSL